MQTFATARSAKEFLIDKIIFQSQLEGVPLTDVEKKMLYFSESGWTLPDIDQISDAFDRDYDQALYEEKIGGLVRNFRARARKENRQELDTWEKAVARLREEDHFLLVLIDNPDHTSFVPASSRLFKLLAIGFGLACLICIVSYLFIRIF